MDSLLQAYAILHNAHKECCLDRPYAIREFIMHAEAYIDKLILAELHPETVGKDSLF